MNYRQLSNMEVFRLLDNKLSLSVIEEMSKKGNYFENGLQKQDFVKIEKIYDLTLSEDFKSFYSKILPMGPGFYNWRDYSEENILILKEKMHNQILSGILFDVEHNDFWLESWGEMPLNIDERKNIAEELFVQAPKLIPIYQHRYMSETIIGSNGFPIISIWQADIIYYGMNIYDYLHREFLSQQSEKVLQYSTIPFWSNIILGK